MEYNINMNGIDVNAHYSETAVDGIFLPLLSKFTKMQKEKGGRVLIYMAAPPGAGKSTLCSFLQKLSEERADLTAVQAVGMDGFHRRQEYLLTHTAIRDGKEVRMVDIKGAPVTFDLELLTQRIMDVVNLDRVSWPAYDRHLHNPVDDAVTVDRDIVLLEGNYLLLDEEGWRDLSDHADLSIFIRAEEGMLRDRLIDRKIKSGNTAEDAIKFVDYSDMANVRLCLSRSKKPDIMINLDEKGEYHWSIMGTVL